MQKNQVTIVGAGVPGLCLALLLGNMGVNVTIMERGCLPTLCDVEKPTSRTAAFMNGSIDTLNRAGIVDDIPWLGTALKILRIIDDSQYPRGHKNMVEESFRAEEMGRDQFGYNIPLIPLTFAMSKDVRNHENITVIENVNVDQNHESILTADLVVGADGRRSTVRDWSGIQYDEKSYDQMAITCVISHSQSHNHTSTEFHRSGGPCTFVPNGEGQSAVVWVEKTQDAEQFMTLSKQAFVQALQERTRGVLGQIDLVVEPTAWPLMTLKAKQFMASKTALIAEAAHVVSPIGAQGLNLSLRDVSVLADLIENAIRNGDDIGGDKMLRAYQRRRQRDINTRHIGVDLFNQMVANDNVILREMRRLGLRAMRHIKPMRAFLMREGLGR